MTQAESGAARGLRDLLDEDGLRSVYQPIVQLDTRETVAFEALVRGPVDSPFEMPGALFPEAERLGLLSDLDLAAQRVALSGAVEARLDPATRLFVNIEPSILEGGEPLPDALVQALGDGDEASLRVVVELTERALATRPADVLATVERLRALGCGIALDDVGVDRRSLALLPMLSPDVIKLDMSIVQQRETTPETAHIVNAVAAAAERSGASVLAEGIETEEHLLRARAMGATLGQGWLFGRPGELPEDTSTLQDPMAPNALLIDGEAPRRTPVEIVAAERKLRLGDKRLLLALSRQLEAEAAMLDQEVVVIATFQDERFFSQASRRRYAHLAQSAAFVGVLGVGIDSEPAPGVRGGQIEEQDPLHGEWDVVAIGPHFAGGFVAIDLGDDGADPDRRFEFHLTYDRDLVSSLARSLMLRISPAPDPAPPA